MRLGLVLGGAAEGWNKAEEMRIKREAADRALEEHTWKQEANERDASRRRGLAAIPMVGEELSGRWDPAKAVADASAPPQETQAPAAQQPGLLARLGQRLGLGGEQGAPAAPAETAAPPAPSAGLPMAAPANPNDAAVEGITVRPPADRQATELDTARAMVAFARHHGDPQLLATSMDSLVKLETREAKKDIARAVAGGPEMLAAAFERVTDQLVDITENPNGTFSVSVEGGKPRVFKDIREIGGELMSALEGDPMIALNISTTLAADRRAEEQLKQTGEYQAAMAAVARENAVTSRMNAGTNAAAVGEQIEASRASRGRMAVWEDLSSQDPLLADPLVRAHAMVMAGANPDYAYVRESTDAEGMPVTVRGNKLVDLHELRLNAAQQRYQASPFVQQGLLSISTMGGQRLYRVKGDPNGYTSFDAAERAARRVAKSQQQK